MGGRPPIMRADRWPIIRTVGILHGGDNAAGLRGPIQLEVIVNRGQAPVERATKLEIVVQLAVGTDVQLHAVQQLQPVTDLRLQRANALPLFDKRVAADARQRPFGVIGDGQDAVTARARGSNHILQRRTPIARDGGVNVKVAAHRPDRLRQGAVFRRLDLAASSRNTGGMNGNPRAA